MTCREAASAELQHSLLQEVLMALQKLDLTTSGVGMLLRIQTALRGTVGCSACTCKAEAGKELCQLSWQIRSVRACRLC